MQFPILFIILICCVGFYSAQKNRTQRLNLKTKTSKAGHVYKTFDSLGPHTYDYLLGRDKYLKSDRDIVFVDHDIEANVIKRYQNEGKLVICYINVGAWEKWRSDASIFPKSVLGNDYEGWEGEKWLDIRKIDTLMPIMRKRFQAAKSKGCQGIDPDNMNGYTVNTGFTLTYDDQYDYNYALSEEIHSLGIMAGLKNDNEQAADLSQDFDFAVLEQCASNDECGFLDSFIKVGKPVFDIEYTDKWNKQNFMKQVCPLQKKHSISYILKHLNLNDDFIVTC